MRRPTLYIIGLSLIIFFLIMVFFYKKSDGRMVSPFSGILHKPTPSPKVIPSPTPKTFQFDSSTDLRQELDTVNPQVLNSDFNE